MIDAASYIELLVASIGSTEQNTYLECLCLDQLESVGSSLDKTFIHHKAIQNRHLSMIIDS